MKNPLRDNGSVGQIIQVFMPNVRVNTNSQAVEHGQIVRFTAECTYTLDSDGIRVPIGAGGVIAIPSDVSLLEVYSTDGSILQAQILEIM